jgi:CheY-like chemotaxis protein
MQHQSLQYPTLDLVFLCNSFANLSRVGPHKLARILDQCLIYMSRLHSHQILLESPSPGDPHHVEKAAIVADMTSLEQPPIETTIQLKRFDTDLQQHSIDQMINSTTPSRVPTPPSEGRRVKVMLVEDNIINLKILINYMTKANRLFVTACNGREALQLYQATPEAFSIILMDISMPVMDGLESTREIRTFERQNRLSRTRIIALTCFSSLEYQKDAALSGIDMFLVSNSQSLPYPLSKSLLIDYID